MNYRFFAFIITFLQFSNAFSQKNFPISTSETMPKIDGFTDDSVWMAAGAVRDFTTTLPCFNQTPGHATEVKILQCPKGLAIAVWCESNLVRMDGSVRDDPGTADYFTISLDTWNDDQNAFTFTITAFGQKMDGRLYSGGEERAYDVYWSAQTRHQADGWTAELFIPWTALRFPVRGPQHWGLQLTRFDRSTGETSTWSPDDPLIEDKVLQYGEIMLQGPLRQKVRMGVSWLGQTQWSRDNGIDPEYSFMEYDFGVSVLDGSVGLGSAATLDMNLFHYTEGLADYYNVINNYEDGHLALPRRLSAEESGIFLKNRIYDSDPLFSFRYLFNQLPDSRFMDSDFDYSKPKPINHLKFTARTKNGIGIGIVNRIFEKPLIDVFNYLTYSNASIQYPDRPNANQIVLEKTLPNNSWIQFSNSNFHVGKNLNSNRSGITTQLRDKTNRFQLRGDFRIQSEKTKASDRFAVADGSVGLYKINGTWTGGLGYESLPRVYSELITTPEGFYKRPRGDHRIFSSVARNNFQSGRKTLNSTTSLFADVFWEKGISDIYRGRIGLRERRLGRRFSEWSAELSLNPFLQKDTLNLGDISIFRSLPSSITLKTEYTSDLRKKLTTQLILSSNWYTGSDIFDFSMSASPRWVIHPKIIAQSFHIIGYFNHQIRISHNLIHLTLTEEYKSIHLKNGLNAQFQASRKFRLQTNGGVFADWPLQLQVYQLDGSSDKIPYSSPTHKTLTFKSLTTYFELNAHWIFTSTSILSLTSRWNGRSGTMSYIGPTGVSQFKFHSKTFLFNVSWSLNLYRR